MAERMEEQARDFGFLNWINVLLGIWLILSPLVLRYSSIAAAFSTEVALGVLVLGLALFVGFRHMSVVSKAHVGSSTDAAVAWLQIPLGVLIIIAPFLLGYAPVLGALVINNILIGVIVVLVGLYVALTHQASIETPMRRA